MSSHFPSASDELTDIASKIDHTCLKADAGAKQLEQLCLEAIEHRFYSVCVHGSWVSACRGWLNGTGVKISAVCGFPLGAHSGRVKAFEAEQAAKSGAAEIDMVLQVGRLIDGRYDEVGEDISAVVRAVADAARVKVILETGLLTDELKRIGCRLAVEAGAHFVKTSTGFGPGGATVEDVRLMRDSVPASVGVKASGGIRDLDAARRMIAAGAVRLGTSSGVKIVQGIRGDLPDPASGAY